MIAHANPLQFHSMHMEIGNEVLTCCLYDSGWQPNTDVWYATASGGVYRAEIKEGPVNGDFSRIRLGSVIWLRDADAIAGYVGMAAASHLLKRGGRTALLDPSIEALTILSLYPGSFSTQDTEERRCIIVQSLIGAIANAGIRLPVQTFASFVYFLLIAQGVTPLVRHLLDCLPLSLAGMLTAHGLASEKIWDRRYSEALVEGWRYQLRHPEEEYLIPMPAQDDHFLRPLLDYAEPPLRRMMLAATRLAWGDVAHARTLGAAIAGGDTGSYTRSVLSYLAHRAYEGPAPEADIGLPGEMVS